MKQRFFSGAVATIALVTCVGLMSASADLTGPIGPKQPIFGAVVVATGEVLLAEVSGDLPSGPGYTALNNGGAQILSAHMNEAYGSSGPSAGDVVTILGVTDPAWVWGNVAKPGARHYMENRLGGDPSAEATGDPHWEWD